MSSLLETFKQSSGEVLDSYRSGDCDYLAAVFAMNMAVDQFTCATAIEGPEQAELEEVFLAFSRFHIEAMRRGDQTPEEVPATIERRAQSLFYNPDVIPAVRTIEAEYLIATLD